MIVLMFQVFVAVFITATAIEATFRLRHLFGRWADATKIRASPDDATRTGQAAALDRTVKAEAAVESAAGASHLSTEAPRS